MKKALLPFSAFAFLCLAQASFAQSNGLSAYSPQAAGTESTTAPKLTHDAHFPNLSQYLSDALQYPQLARDNGIEGVVVAEATIGADGSVVSAELAQRLGFGCDEAVLALLAQMPKWQPATENGEAVGQKVYIQVRFRLR